jgi:cytoskeletal protein RodZ
VPRRALLVIAWLVGGLAAVSLASAAVSRVGNEVTGDRPSPLSAEEVAAELAAESTTTTEPDGGTPSTSPTSETATSAPTPTTVAPPPSTVAPPPPTSAAEGELRTYALVGGTATLRFTPAGVTVVTANPNPGYKVEVEPAYGNGVEVSFETDHHKSKVEGWWDGGPRDQVDEEADEDDD